jgi:hypothetical protein
VLCNIICRFFFVELPFDLRRTVLHPAYVITDVTTDVTVGVIVLPSYAMPSFVMCPTSWRLDILCPTYYRPAPWRTTYYITAVLRSMHCGHASCGLVSCNLSYCILP